MDEVEIEKLGAVSLANGSTDALADNVDAYADLGWMRLGVGGEKMAVTAADLPNKRGRLGKLGVGGGLVGWDGTGGGSRCGG